jgi:hypothetical protein
MMTCWGGPSRSTHPSFPSQIYNLPRFHPMLAWTTLSRWPFIITYLKHCMAKHSSAGNPMSTPQILVARKNSGRHSFLKPAVPLIPHIVPTCERSPPCESVNPFLQSLPGVKQIILLPSRSSLVSRHAGPFCPLF